MSATDTSLSPRYLPEVLLGPEHEQRRRTVEAALFGGTADAVAFGRYRLLHLLGQGAAGSVHAAYDDHLDRKVALKLIRQSRLDSAEVRARTLREARALARLSHPNVVSVYEVGEIDGQMFVAMEYIAGRTLRAWQAPRGWRDVLAMYLQAGRGLAAAHASELVHRDFKPDNVLVGIDGRARVVDFGLARSFDGDDARPQDADRLDWEMLVPGLGAPLGSYTGTGAIVGTPRYMSPEQHSRRSATARSDQYSFCVALWEGLYGSPPFVGTSLEVLSARVTAGQREPPPRDTEVPASILAILSRGLALDSLSRWPSLDALLAALAADPEFAGDPEFDPKVSRRPRMLLGLALGAFPVINACLMLGLEVRRGRTPTTGDVLSDGAVAWTITFGLVFLARRHVLTSSVNRRLIFVLLLITSSTLANRCIGHILGAPVPYVLAVDMLIALALSVLAGVVLVRGVIYIGLTFAAGILATVALPGEAETILALTQGVWWLAAIPYLLGYGTRNLAEVRATSTAGTYP